MNEKLTPEQRVIEVLYNRAKKAGVYFDGNNIDIQLMIISDLSFQLVAKEIVEALTAEDECMCQCFTCQGSGKWASGFCPDSENPAHTTEDKVVIKEESNNEIL